MSNRSVTPKKQITIFCILFLVFLLFGCAPAPQQEAAEPASGQPTSSGDVENGRKLFMGYVHLENDGPPCMGCHNIGANGILGGGALGPDLTNVSKERSYPELASILSNFGFTSSPVMEPIYSKHPLTNKEQADLIAFMQASVGEPEEDKEVLVLGISILATIGAAFAIGFVYRDRLRRIRAAMVNEAKKELL